MKAQNKKAIILDLDNTIYPVSAISKEVFAPLMELIRESNDFNDQLAEIERDIQRKPFQFVADKFGFSNVFSNQCYFLLMTTTYEKPIDPFPDYEILRRLPINRYLVTSGFKNLQWSKIRNLGIGQDFKEVHVVDALTSNLTKKTVFVDILHRSGLLPLDLLVIGDDPESEIKAARELDIDYVLYDKIGIYKELDVPRRITDYKDIFDFLRLSNNSLTA